MVFATNDIFSKRGNLAGGAFDTDAVHTRYKRMNSILRNHFQWQIQKVFTALEKTAPPWKIRNSNPPAADKYQNTKQM